MDAVTDRSVDDDGAKQYKISDDPFSRRCGFAGCQRWLKKDGHCAPCVVKKERQDVAIAEWNADLRSDQGLTLMKR